MQESTGLLELLGRTLQVEHAMAGTYFKLVEACADEETKDLVRKLEHESEAHVRIVQEAIEGLGGQHQGPQGVVHSQGATLKVFHDQLEWERLALWCHKKASGLASDPRLKKTLAGIAEAEVNHMAIVEEIILKLGK